MITKMNTHQYPQRKCAKYLLFLLETTLGVHCGLKLAMVPSSLGGQEEKKRKREDRNDSLWRRLAALGAVFSRWDAKNSTLQWIYAPSVDEKSPRIEGYSDQIPQPCSTDRPSHR